MAVRVVLVDDQPLIRSALRVLIADADDLEVVGEAGGGGEAVDLVRQVRARRGRHGHPHARHGRHHGHPPHRRRPGPPRVLVLTTFDDDEYVYGALRAGASGFLVKDMALEDILGAIRVVAGGDSLIAPRVTRLLIEQFLTRPAPRRRPSRRRRWPVGHRA